MTDFMQFNKDGEAVMRDIFTKEITRPCPIAKATMSKQLQAFVFPNAFAEVPRRGLLQQQTPLTWCEN
jgi:hypothetical protein